MASMGESDRKKFSNWLQSVKCLETTKTSLHGEVLRRWKKELLSWSEEERKWILTFIGCIAKEEVRYIKKTRKWKCECVHKECQMILERLVALQQNPGSKVVWNSSLCEKIKENETIMVTTDANHVSFPRLGKATPKKALDTVFGPSKLNSDETQDYSIDYEDVFTDCKEYHVWCLANMFMQLRTGKDTVTNTGPGNTDASMFFKMMKNCKLFDLEGENPLYDTVIKCRDMLHDTANDRISKEEAKKHFNTLVEFLEQFGDVQKCKDAIQAIKQMLSETILCISVPDDVIETLAKDVLQLKYSALEVDKEIETAEGFSCDGTDKLMNETNNKIKKVSQNKPISSDVKKYKNPSSHLEKAIDLLNKSSTLPQVAEGIKLMNTLVDEIIDDASETDVGFKVKANTVMQGEVISEESPNEDQITETHKNTDTTNDTAHEQNYSSHVTSSHSTKLQEQKKQMQYLARILVEGSENPHIASVLPSFISVMAEEVDEAERVDPTFKEIKEKVAKVEEESEKKEDCVQEQSMVSLSIPDTGKQTYKIKLNNDKQRCDITACCQIPNGEVLLIDYENEALKKLSVDYNVVNHLNLPSKPYRVCYLGNDTAVVSLRKKSLMFINVTDLTIAKEVPTDHICLGLAFHTDKLYVGNTTTVYLYNTEGKQQRVVFTQGKNIDGIAVCDDGNILYIAAKDAIFTLDKDGNVIFKLMDQQIQDVHGICMDGRGNVLICDRNEHKIFQISYDGQRILQTVCENIVGRPWAICFNRQKSLIVCAGDADYLTVLEL